MAVAAVEAEEGGVADPLQLTGRLQRNLPKHPSRIPKNRLPLPLYQVKSAIYTPHTSSLLSLLAMFRVAIKESVVLPIIYFL